MRQLSSLDARFLAMESRTRYAHVAGLAKFDPRTAPGGEFGRREVCRLLSQRMHLLPPMRERLVEVPFGLDNPYWVEDPEFDLDFHIRDIALPPPGTDSQLAEQVARLASRPLDRRHPLWELYVIHGLEGGLVALLTKLHHAAIDGMSGAEILGIMFDSEADPEARELPEPKAADAEPPPPIPGWGTMLARGAMALPMQPVRALSAVPTAVANLDELPVVRDLPGAGLASRLTRSAQKLVTGSDDSILERPKSGVRLPRTMFNRKVSQHRRFVFDTVPLEEVKAFKNAFGVSVNDVVVAICAGAVRSFLQRHDDLPDEPLIAMIPLSTRAPEEQGTFGNRISFMLVPIPTDEPDAGQRLRRAHEALKSAKDRHQAIPASILSDVTQFVPPALATRASRGVAEVSARLRPPLNLIISNVPGPRETLHCAGAEMLSNTAVSVITDGVGLNITVQSYRDRLDFGVVADRDHVDDLWPLMDDLHTSLDELRELMPEPAPTAPAAEKVG